MATATERPAVEGTVTLLFTDLVGSTELLGRIGDEAAESVRRAHFGLLRDAVIARGGHEVKNLGDGLMVAFPSAADAVRCAVDMQQTVDRHNRRAGQVPLAVRVGLHVGEPVRDEGDYFGTPVVVAQRLCDAASGGQIIASHLVRALAGGTAGVQFTDLEPIDLKGLAAPVPACTVVWARARGPCRCRPRCQPNRMRCSSTEPMRWRNWKPCGRKQPAGSASSRSWWGSRESARRD